MPMSTNGFESRIYKELLLLNKNNIDHKNKHKWNYLIKEF